MGSGTAMKTSEKVLGLLRLFSTEQPVWTVEAAAGALGLPQSTAYDHFRSLGQAGLIASTGAGRYVLGPAVIELDRIARSSDPILLEGGPILARLVAEPPVAVVGLLCRLYREKVMCVDQRASQEADAAISYERGRLMPLFRGAASKVILAHLERRRLHRLFEENASDIAANGLGHTWSEFRSTLRAIRSRDAFVTRGELDAGRVGISIALLAGSGEAFGSMSLVVEERDYDRSEAVRRELHARLGQASAQLTARVGDGFGSTGG